MERGCLHWGQDWMGCQHHVTKCKGGLFLLPQNFPKQQTSSTLLLETVATPAWTNLLNVYRTRLLIGNHSHSATPPCRPFLIGRGLAGGRESRVTGQPCKNPKGSPQQPSREIGYVRGNSLDPRGELNKLLTVRKPSLHTVFHPCHIPPK